MSDKTKMLQDFREYYMKNGRSAQSVVDFISQKEDMITAMEAENKPLDELLKDQIGEFYEYFSSEFGDDDEIMNLIQGKWNTKPPTILLLGFQRMFEKGEKIIADKYSSVQEGSREEYNISQLAKFISMRPCRVSIIGPENASYEFDWPLEVSSQEITPVNMLNGMLTDFIRLGDGMIVRRYSNAKDEVFGFIPENGSVQCMEKDNLAFAMSSHADSTMKTYLDNVEIKKAELSFR